MSDDPTSSPLHRLGAAVAAFLEYETGSLTAAGLLDKHGDLRDLLEPMLAAQVAAAAVASGGSAAGAGVADAGADAGADADADTGAGADGTPRFLGPYRLLREIGRGGMGVVYEAEDTSLGRRVALKVLPPNLNQSPRQIERFRREAAAAARLEHRGIVPIFNVGEADGSHYFAMELVAGPSLHAALVAVRETQPDFAAGFAAGFAAADLNAGFTGGYLVQVVEVLSQVAEALAAAHAGGVIHRDIKPHNLLLTGAGTVRVVDFGLAKDLGRMTISHSQEIAGTPQYMSPEQISGLRHVDRRTDVFSLGVVMYEMLTLRCPFDAPSTQGLMLSITTQEPKHLRRLSPRTPRELEVICHKAIEKNPIHRYQTAAALAADLRRFLRHEPIVARPPSTLIRMVKLVQRRRAASVAVALTAILLAGGAVFYVSYYRPATEELAQNKVALAAEQAESKKTQKLSDESLRAAQQSLGRHLARAMELAERPGMRQTAKGMVEEALALLERIRANKDRFTEHLVVLGHAYMQLASLRTSFGEFAIARADFDRAIAVFDELIRDHPPQDRYFHDRAKARSLGGVILHELGQSAAGEREIRGAIAAWNDHLLQPQWAVERAETNMALIQGWISLAATLSNTPERWPRAVQALEQALALIAAYPKGVRGIELARLRIQALLSLGRVHTFREDMQEAEEAFLRGIEVGDAAARSGESSADWREPVLIHRALGEIRQATGRHALAKDDFSSAVRIARILHEKFPSATSCVHDLARSLRDLGLILGQQGRHREAHHALAEAKDYVDALPAATADIGLYRTTRATVYGGLALVRSQTATPENYAEIEALFRQAIEIQAAVIRAEPARAGAKHVQARIFHNLASMYQPLGMVEEGLAACRSAIAMTADTLRIQPASARYQRHADLHAVLLAQLEVAAGDRRAAEAAIRPVLRDGQRNAMVVYESARLFVRCADLAAADISLIPPERDATVERLRRAAMRVVVGLSRQPKLAGMIRRDEAFASLRQREDWIGLFGGR